MIEVNQLFKHYKQGHTRIDILKGLNLKVQSGEVIAILGDSGSGKSTFLSLMGGLDRPDSGQIIINGQDLTVLDEEQLTKFRGDNIGIVFQQYHLVPYLSAWENVQLPLEIRGESEQAKPRAKEALEMVGLGGRLSHLPHQLSGGECQRVAMARALVVRPQLLLADEPNGNLDQRTGAQVLDLLFSLLRQFKITSLIVTHSPELASRCDRQLILKDGVLN